MSDFYPNSGRESTFVRRRRIGNLAWRSRVGGYKMTVRRAIFVATHAVHLDDYFCVNTC
jgi:hypothetical protein